MARSRAVVVLDLPAHGLSDGSDGFSPAGADALKAVAAELGPITAVVAHSLGCWASALAIGEGMSVSQFVLIAPPGGASRERWRRAAQRMGYSEHVADAALAEFWRRLGPHRGQDLKEILAPLDVEMLFIHSTADERGPLEQSRQLREACRNARLFEIDAANHRDTARDAQAIAAIVMFLASTQ
jgi:pimeloyl-ACP methyl ester carboxylesterase